MIGEFPVDGPTTECFFGELPRQTLRAFDRSAFSSVASLDRGAREHTISHVPHVTLTVETCELRRPSLRRIHRVTPLSNRGRRGGERSLARVHLPHPRRADRPYAVLRRAAERTGASRLRVTHARPC